MVQEVWLAVARKCPGPWRSYMPIDTALIGALHVDYFVKQDLTEEDPLHHTLFQTSTIDSLLDGNYEGDVSFAELKPHGDFGLGTFDALDGEMVALDGDYYQVRADGRAYPVDWQTKTPFAVVTFFEPTLSETLGAANLADLCERVDWLSGEAIRCCSVRVDGRFDHVRTRSVPRQRKPYPPLVEVVQDQPVFELDDVRGSLVGFKFPDYAQGLNVAGYHFHFITDDRSAGGHVLECRLATGELRVDREADLKVELPPGVSLPTPDQSASRKETIDRIEKG
jgi:acetolactate decarboxylase